MGYLLDNVPPGQFYVLCADLYIFRLEIEPRFSTDRELMKKVKDVIPDIEEWQFSGRRRRPLSDGRQSRINFPINYAVNSRRMREFEDFVVFAFHTVEQRAAVATRLVNEGYTIKLLNEPT